MQANFNSDRYPAAGSRRTGCVGLVLLILAVVTPQGTYAQTTAGKILGTVEDSSHAVIPSATVSVTNVRTNISSHTTTNELGYYEFVGLGPGEYEIEAEQPGFKRFVRSGVVLQVQQQARINMTLAPGDVKETVSIAGQAVLLETATSALGQVVTQREIMDLPLNGRNPFQLAMLSAGVSGLDGGTGSGQQFVAGFYGSMIQSSTINGGRQGMTEVYMDGSPNTFSDNGAGSLGVAYSPSVDSVQEFKVITNNMSAEFGNSGSGVVSIVTKSGTNEFHGTLFEFLRNSVFDANNFFNNRAGLPQHSFKRNQFGGNFGGPLYRNKTFFFVDYDGTRERALSTVTRSVPVPEWRNGDFSNLFTGDASLTDCLGRKFDTGQIFNPFSLRSVTCADGSSGSVRDPFTGNIIPESLKSPAALAVLKYFPLPNRPGTSSNFIGSASATNNSDQFDIRLDHNISDRQRLLGRYSSITGYSAPPNFYNNIADPAFFPFPSGARQAMVEHNINFSPATLLTTGLSYSRLRFETRSGGPGFQVTDIGQSTAFNDLIKVHQFPLFTFSSIDGLGGGFVGSRQAAERYSLRAALTRIQGRHSLKMGGQIDMMRTNEGSPAYPSGSYSFGPGFTSGPNPLAGGGGSDFAAFLLGLPSTTISQDVFRAMQSWYYGMYIQDDIKVSRKLTLNVGVRYDLAIPYTERHNRATWFDFDAKFPVQLPAENVQQLVSGAASQGITLGDADLARLTNLRGGERFAGKDGSRHVFNMDKNNVGPRFGFAYQVNNRTVVRGGTGIFYGPAPTAAQGTSGPFNIDGFGTLQGVVNTLDTITPLCQPASVDPARKYCLENPVPNGLTPLLGSSKGLLTFFDPAGGVISMQHDMPNTTVYNWNFGVQEMVPGSILVSAAYVGSRALHFPTGTAAINPLNQLTRATVAKFKDQLFQQVPNPFYGIVKDPNSPLSSPTVQLSNLLVPFPQFPLFPFLTYSPLNGQSSYHAFQLRVEKPLSHGLSFLASYTNSKNLDNGEGTLFTTGSHAFGPQDNYNYGKLEKSLAGQDVPQRFVFSPIYELPFGRGRKFAIANRALDAVLGGWQVNGILTLGRGVPIPWAYLATDSRISIGTTNVRMNETCNPVLSGPIEDRLDHYFNTACFSDPAPYTLGTAPRTDAKLRTPGVRNVDFSLFKNFHITERWEIQFRTEFFNLTNTPRFIYSYGFGSKAFATFPAGGNTGLNPKFGVLDTQANDPRKVQFGLKIYF